MRAQTLLSHLVSDNGSMKQLSGRAENLLSWIFLRQTLIKNRAVAEFVTGKILSGTE